VAVYGVPEHQPVAENAPLLPTSPYGANIHVWQRGL
jgi:UDP-glucose 4-epimerase